jgi:hypothetical protein
MVLVFFRIFKAGFFEVIRVDLDFEFFQFMVLLDDLSVDKENEHSEKAIKL